MSSINYNKNGEHQTSSIWEVDKYQLAEMQHNLSTQPTILSKSAGRSSCCIYRAPQNLMDVNGRSYHPQIVSIGPYHHGLKRLKMIEEHKWRFLSLLLNRIQTKNITLEDLLKAVQPLELRTRDCYSEILDIEHDKLIEILVLDGCFIIELFRKVGGLVPFEAGDPLMTMTWIFSTFLRDLIRLENQIPFFVLDCLFKLTQMPGEEESGQSLAILTLKFFNSTLQRPQNVIAKYRHLQGKHILDLLRSSFIPPDQTHTGAISEERESGSTVMGPPNMMCVIQMPTIGDQFAVREEEEGGSMVRTPRKKAMRVNEGESMVLDQSHTRIISEEGEGVSTVMAPPKMICVNEGGSMVLDQSHTRAIGEEGKGKPMLMLVDFEDSVDFEDDFDDSVDFEDSVVFKDDFPGQNRAMTLDLSRTLPSGTRLSMALNQSHTREMHVNQDESMKMEVTRFAQRVDKSWSTAMALPRLNRVNQRGPIVLDQSQTCAIGDQFAKNTHLIHCVSKLRCAGISLKPAQEDSFLNIKYSRGVIEMPTITIDDFMSEFLLNCVAYEQCHNDPSSHMTTYALLLDCLINTSRDVEYLSQQNVIENYLGSDEEAAKFINDLAKYVAFGIHQCYLAGIFDEVNEYYNTKWHVMLESFMHKYFRNPWSFISVMAAFVLLVLTVLQTVYTIIG